jgi:hypothetical protein
VNMARPKVAATPQENVARAMKMYPRMLPCAVDVVIGALF